MSSYEDIEEIKKLRDSHKEIPTDFFCRLLLMLGVSRIEEEIKDWARSNPDLKRYAVRYLSRRSSNGEKLEALKEMLSRTTQRLSSVPLWAESDLVSKDLDRIREDYLALKFLRNAYVHAEPLTEEKEEQVRKQGFPTDLTGFTTDHWSRIASVITDLVYLIMVTGQTSVPGRLAIAPGAVMMKCGHFCASEQMADDREMIHCCICANRSPCRICRKRRFST